MDLSVVKLLAAGLSASYVDPLIQLDGQFDFPMRAELSRVLLRRQGSVVDLAGCIDYNSKGDGCGAGDEHLHRQPRLAARHPPGRGHAALWLQERLRALTRIRRDQVALRRSQLEVLGATADTLVYQMRAEGQRVVVAINRRGITKTADGVPTANYTDLLGDADAPAPPSPAISLATRSVELLRAE